MDLSKYLGQWKEQSPEQWLRTANRYLPPGATAILVLAIAYQLAALTWLLVPGGAPPAAATSRTSTLSDAPEKPAADDDARGAARPPCRTPPRTPPRPTRRSGRGTRGGMLRRSPSRSSRASPMRQ